MTEVDLIPRSTAAAWGLHLSIHRLKGPADTDACSRTAVAELWCYGDPGHPDHGTWSFQLLDRRWPTPPDTARSPAWLRHPDALQPFGSWQDCYDALAAVRWARGFTPS